MGSLQEGLPVRHVISVPKKEGDGHKLRLFWRAKKPQATFFRSLVSFLAVDSPVSEDAVFPAGESAARARDDVVDVPFRRSQPTTGVLAPAPITLPDTTCSKFGTLHRDLIVLGKYDNGGNADFSAGSPNSLVFVPDGEFDPILPASGKHVILTMDIESGRDIRAHLAEGLSRGGRIDGLPVPVENENKVFV